MGLIRELLDMCIPVQKRDYKDTVRKHKKLELLLAEKLAQTQSPAEYAHLIVYRYTLLPPPLKEHLGSLVETIIASSGLYDLPLLPEYEDTKALYQHRDYLLSMEEIINSFDEFEIHILTLAESIVEILLSSLPAPPSTETTEISFEITAEQHFHHTGSDILDTALGYFFNPPFSSTAIFSRWRIVIINNFEDLYNRYGIKGTKYTAEILKTKVAPEDLAQAIFSPLPLVYLFNFSIPFSISLENRFNHQYVLGKTGSGKSVLLRHQIAHDLNAGHGVVLITPERDLINDVLSYVPKSRKDDVVYFDPSDDSTPAVGFNPFESTEKHNLSRQAGELETILVRTLGEMGVKMKPVLSNSIYALLATQGSFQDLPKLLDPDDSSYRDNISSKLDERTRDFFKKYETSRYYKDVYEPMINRIEPLLRSPLVTTLSTPAFNFDRLLNYSKSIFLCNLSQLRGFQEEVVGQLLLATFQETFFLRDAIPEKNRLPYFFYMDEFQTYATSSEVSLKKFLTRARKYKVGVVMAHQNTDDIPSNLLASIYGNCGTLTGMLMSAKDASTFTREAQLANFSAFSKAETQLQNFMPGQISIATPDIKQARICRFSEHPPFPRFNNQIEALKKHSKYKFSVTPPPPPEKPPSINKDDSDPKPPDDWDELGYRLS